MRLVRVDGEQKANLARSSMHSKPLRIGSEVRWAEDALKQKIDATKLMPSSISYARSAGAQLRRHGVIRVDSQHIQCTECGQRFIAERPRNQSASRSS